MKKYVVVAIALAIVTQACQKIEEFEGQSNLPENILTASINAETRTMLGESDGTKYAFWSEGDEIGVFIDGKSKTTYTLKDGAGTPKATFTGFGTGSNYVAVYPAVAAESINGNTINLNLPSEQIWAASSFGPNSFPMVTVSNTANLTFRNLCSVFKIQLLGNATILSISFKPNDEAIRVAGEAVADISNPEDPVLTMSKDALNEVTLKCPEGGVTLFGDKPVDFYIVLPAQAYTGGFALTIRSTGGTMIQRTTNNLDMHRSEIRAAEPFEFKVTEGITASESLAGEGTLEMPFLIQNVSDLLLFQQAVNSANGKITSADSGSEVAAQTANYKLTNDIDMAVYNGTVGSWTPIGDASTDESFSFQGSFDGNGHSITNLYISSDKSYQGLFGSMNGASAQIMNLTVKGEVSGNSYVGMIAGSAAKYITNCKSYGSVTGTGSDIGGIVGQLPSGAQMSDCSNYAEIKGYSNTGGVAGYLDYAMVYNCANYGDVSNLNVRGYVSSSTGGVAGYANCSNIYNCSNSGNVNGWLYVGGIVGLQWSTKKYSVSNCYNTGNIYASRGIIGGIAGIMQNAMLSNCINTGTVSVDLSGSEKESIGAIVGLNFHATISNCYWLSTSGTSAIGTDDSGTSESVYSLNASQMNNSSLASSSLYTDERGEYYFIVDALNAWAADNSIPANYPNYGWVVNDGDRCPTFTFEAAVHPGGGSNVNIHSFGILHTNPTFSIPIITGDFIMASVDWGDSKAEPYAESLVHTYASEREYMVTVTADGATSFKIKSLKGVSKLDLK